MKRYNHNRSNTRIQDMDMGKIVPTRASHCIAGTTLKGGVAAAMELAPLVHQTLGSMRVDTWAISAADRLLWEDAEAFYTGGDDGTSRPTPPYIVAPDETGWAEGSLADYLGFPTGVPGLKCNALPFRLYAMWINENVIDPDIQTPLVFSTASGLDVTTNTTLFNINWTKDMFTTGKLNPTLGNDVVIPLASSAPVYAGNINKDPITKTGIAWKNTSGTGTYTTNHNYMLQPTSGNDAYVGKADQNQYTTSGSNTVYPANLYTDLTNATGILPDDFNFAMAKARWQTRRNLFGHRYKDWLAFLGIKYSDRRLQLPSTLAHGKQIIDVNGVLQTAPASGSYVGQMAGRGSGFGSCKYKTYFEEPTTVIHLVCVRPSTLYVNMMPPEWQFEVREDLFTPEFAHVGMVAEPKGTLYPTGTDADKTTMLYRNRYDEMRSGFNSVCGKFKSTNASYHQGRIFASAPSLNSDFLECNPSNRIFADLNGKHIEACAVRNTFIERNIVTPDGNPHYN